MSHKYYAEDSEERKRYFDEHFRRLAGTETMNVIDLSSFRDTLERAFEKDASLSAYFSNMSDEEIIIFFERHQDLVEKNIQAMSKKEREEVFQGVPEIPLKKKAKPTAESFSFLQGFRKGQRTFGYQTSIQIKGKTYTKYRDVKGRFIAVSKESKEHSSFKT
jgi:hypothetical protein